MRTLAIGDIHGCAAALDALLRIVAPTADDVIVPLGDYVDRGPDSAGVIQRLITLARTHKVVPLRGNHEQMMMEARDSLERLQMWTACGGDAALRSYATLDELGNLADVPDEHWDFLDNTCRDWHETPTHIFVHAGAYADLDMQDQSVDILRWETFDDPPPHMSGKILVCGHTPQKDGAPLSVGHAICIDTYAHGPGGWLTCLDTASGRIWQANQAGQTRRSWVDEASSKK